MATDQSKLEQELHRLGINPNAGGTTPDGIVVESLIKHLHCIFCGTKTTGRQARFDGSRLRFVAVVCPSCFALICLAITDGEATNEEAWALLESRHRRFEISKVSLTFKSALAQFRAERAKAQADAKRAASHTSPSRYLSDDDFARILAENTA